MRKLILIMLFINFLTSGIRAQLYINGDITLQNSALLFADDSIQSGPSAVIITNGILQSTKGINTNQRLINTGTSGLVILPLAPGINKSIDIGISENNQIQILHNSSGVVIYELAVRDSIFQNPQTRVSNISSAVVNKTWMIHPLSPSTGNTISIGWNGTNEQSGFTRSNCGMSSWQSSVTTAWSFLNGTNAAIISGSSPPYSRTSPVINLNAAIYYFGIGASGSALPLSLLKFEAYKSNEDVLVDWITTREINTSYFEIERSPDGHSFSSVGKVKASGNDNLEKKYSYMDLNPFHTLQVETLFYRLKTTDLDQSFKYSDIRVVDSSNPDTYTINIFPNPFEDYVYFSANKSRMIKVNMYDALGRLVFSKNLAEQYSRFDFADLSAGIYTLSIESNQGTNSFKLVKK